MRINQLRLSMIVILIVLASTIAVINFQLRSTSMTQVNHASSRDSSISAGTIASSGPSSGEVRNESIVAKEADVSQIIRTARKYRENRDNVLFDEVQFLSLAARDGSAYFTSISAELNSGESLRKTVPIGEDYYITKPEALLDRMSLMDLLVEHNKPNNDAAIRQMANNTLADIIESAVPRDLPDHIRKIMASEKYDAMRILAEYEPQRAWSSYNSVGNSTMKRILFSALEDGISRSTAGTAKEVARQVAK